MAREEEELSGDEAGCGTIWDCEITRLQFRPDDVNLLWEEGLTGLRHFTDTSPSRQGDMGDNEAHL
jgi:hypothetical protein